MLHVVLFWFAGTKVGNKNLDLKKLKLSLWSSKWFADGLMQRQVNISSPWSQNGFLGSICWNNLKRQSTSFLFVSVFFFFQIQEFRNIFMRFLHDYRDKWPKISFATHYEKYSLCKNNFNSLNKQLNPLVSNKIYPRWGDLISRFTSYVLLKV